MLFANKGLNLVWCMQLASMFIMSIPTSLLNSNLFLNQAHASQRLARAWFLEITSVRMYACVCVGVRPRGHK